MMSDQDECADQRPRDGQPTPQRDGDAPAGEFRPGECHSPAQAVPAETNKPEAQVEQALPLVNGQPFEVCGNLTSVTDLLQALRQHFQPEDVVWFRGHEDATWQLLPSLARPPRTIDAELTVLKRFKQNAFMFLRRPPAEEWEWLFLMQHYRAPTRLLDWSESPLTGLYFASDTDDSTDGCVWALSPTKLNEIARLKPDFPQDIPCFGEDEGPKSICRRASTSVPLPRPIPQRRPSRLVSSRGSTLNSVCSP